MLGNDKYCGCDTAAINNVRCLILTSRKLSDSSTPESDSPSPYYVSSGDDFELPMVNVRGGQHLSDSPTTNSNHGGASRGESATENAIVQHVLAQNLQDSAPAQRCVRVFLCMFVIHVTILYLSLVLGCWNCFTRVIAGCTRRGVFRRGPAGTRVQGLPTVCGDE